MTAHPQDSQSPQPDATDVFVALLVQHRHSIYAFIAKQLVNSADAEDVFQKTSVVLWQKMNLFDSSGSFFHWACGVAFNEVRNFLTTKRRSRLHFDDDLVQILAEESVEEDAISNARLAALQDCMTRLSDRQQQILRSCYAGGDSITEIAKHLGRERGALYKQLARLKAKLLDCIRPRLSQSGVSG